jgi:hypothetical protein
MSPLRLMLAMILVLGIVAVQASAAVFEGSQTDPVGDAVITPGYDGSSRRAMDLTGASVHYDSDSSLLKITLSGDLPVAHREGTFYSGRISTSALRGGTCGSPNRFDDLMFTGYTGTSSAGTEPERFSNGQVSSASLSITGVVLFPADGSIVFEFEGPALVHRDYRCMTDLKADWFDSGNTENVDGVIPFCIVAGCFDFPPPGTPPAVIPVLVTVTTVSTPAPAPLGGAARCLVLSGKIKSTTARMKLMQRASHKGSKAHRRAVIRQARVLSAKRRIYQATYEAICVA